MSVWASVQSAPADPILGVTEAFKCDENPNKINLGVGAYRDDQGEPYVLKCVSIAQERLLGKNHEYAPIGGEKAFQDASAKLALGDDSTVIAERRYATTQTISGTGALRLCGTFLTRWYPFPTGRKVVYLPSPTWGNHIPTFSEGGLDIERYTYYDSNTRGLNFEGMINSIKEMPNMSVILLHACAHNPTGVDLSKEQWAEVSLVVKSKNIFPVFDMAYQGFATGDVDRDAYAVRKFIEDGHEIALCQSYAKNMGLYGERVGALTFTTGSEAQSNAVSSQLKAIIRPTYSNPPIHGARLATMVLTDEKLREMWLVEVKRMADRIIGARALLTQKLVESGSTLSWEHINKQIGMFCYTGLNMEQVVKLRDEHSIYLTLDGRISVAGVTTNNVGYLANAIHRVTV
eukprot:CFRG1621T1